MEAKAWLTRHATNIDNQGEDQEPNNRDELDGRKHEFRLSVNRNSENIQRHHEQNDDGDPYGRADVRIPELNDNTRRRYFRTERQRSRVPVVPADRKAHGRVDIASAVLRDGTSKREPRRHFTKTLHHAEDGDAGERVAEKNRERTCQGEGATDSDEETGSDGAAEGDELNVSRLETALDIAEFYTTTRALVHFFLL